MVRRERVKTKLDKPNELCRKHVMVDINNEKL